ncbi:hypothetical protein R3P38DRAFT_2811696 [Favolaschia claudopus]|uniref:Uncharacterized protein n=1 Tax=Favolaschia claudopus TaxID=2862362 RepID=A0AAV9Z9G4_9AGAR
MNTTTALFLDTAEDDEINEGGDTVRRTSRASTLRLPSPTSPFDYSKIWLSKMSTLGYGNGLWPHGVPLCCSSYSTCKSRHFLMENFESTPNINIIEGSHVKSRETLCRSSSRRAPATAESRGRESNSDAEVPPAIAQEACNRRSEAAELEVGARLVE